MYAEGPTRRHLLRLGGTLAVGAGLAACGGAPGAAPAPTAPATTAPASPPASAGPADWTALAKDLGGTLVRPGDSRYGEAVELFQPQYDTIGPAAVAYVASPQDVATCLAFARRYGVPIVPRNGGHNYAGWSSVNGGLVVDVGRMDTVGTGGSVGAGARLVDVYSGLAQGGRTIPAGSCPSVGVSGLTLGGGVGVTGRANGLTCDNLVGAQIVTPDGRVRELGAHGSDQDADLFWALRGAGGGNFGIVTRLDFRTHPAQDCAYGFLSWSWSKAAAVIGAWQDWGPSAPDALWSNLHLIAQADGRLTVSSTVNLYGGSRTELGNLVDRLGVTPDSASLHSASYLRTMEVMGGVAGRSLARAHVHGSLPGHDPAGTVPRSSYGARSDFFTRPLGADGAAAVVAAVARYPRTAPVGGQAAVAFDALGGAINRVDAGSTAFVHRDALFLAQYTADFAAGADAAARSWSWLDGTWAAMRPHASGEAYQNYADPHLTGWEQAYYGANAARLRQVKRSYDPSGVFRFPQGVPLG